MTEDKMPAGSEKKWISRNYAYIGKMKKKDFPQQ